MAIVKNITPDFVTNQEFGNRKIVVDIPSPMDIPTGDILIIASFEDREATADGASTASLVKVDASGADTVITDGQDLNGYRIGYKAGTDIEAGDPIAGDMRYWSSL